MILRVLSLVAALGVDLERVLATPSPSPGEAHKLPLAPRLAANAWVLVLDEPTNQVDCGRFEIALQSQGLAEISGLECA